LFHPRTSSAWSTACRHQPSTKKQKKHGDHQRFEKHRAVWHQVKVQGAKGNQGRRANTANTGHTANNGKEGKFEKEGKEKKEKKEK
jgi:hypothetical protein